ncbi:LysR substrate-binding domain-containing protein [Streptomyces sp. MNU76]|uniref:LysR substrate-binding domain-containing protein n=1 Tax=Streptomyces sp. MNU76 TaxID=2560026 RepID=UPI0022809786|nr:LysR substrate-binding domain-containing protein [Streptomyces sp. MNU76]
MNHPTRTLVPTSPAQLPTPNAPAPPPDSSATPPSCVQETLRKAEETLSLIQPFEPEHSTQRLSIVMSDYLMTMMAEPLLRAIGSAAPGVRIDIHLPVPAEPTDDTQLRRHDLLLLPLGYRQPGFSEPVLRDRFVCLVDAGGPRLTGRGLSLGDFAEMPQRRPSSARF